jgi:hypothetical protein
MFDFGSSSCADHKKLDNFHSVMALYVLILLQVIVLMDNSLIMFVHI